VVHHFFLGPVQHLAETVHVLKVSHVANGRQRISQIIVLDELKLGLAGHRIFAQILALLNLGNIEIRILAAAQGQLDIALIAQNKGSRNALRANHPAAAVILGFLLERHEVVLPQLRGRAEVQAFAQQGTGKNRAGIAFLQGGVDGHRRGDAGRKAAGAGGVAQGVGNQRLIALSGYRHRKLRLLLRLQLVVIRCHIRYLPFQDNFSGR